MAAYVFIDVSHKQEYIFKHNKLKDNLYNSFVIKVVSEVDDIADLDTSEYIKATLKGHLNENFKGSHDVKYSGGGNSIIRFETEEAAKSFVKNYSTKVLKDYPDLELYMSIVDDSEITATEKGDKEIRRKLHQKADELKDKRQVKFRRWTYGVEKIDETGQAELSGAVKREHKLSKRYLYHKFEEKTQGTSIKVTQELQDYKSTEEGKSYIGVIVIDGNKMGDMVNQISSFEELGQFSQCIGELYESAVIDVLKAFQQEGTSLLITPIVMAGDDICLIVQSDHAIEIAGTIVTRIQELSRDEKYRAALGRFMDGMQEMTACAGVAIARYNHPFFETVKTAEMLCKRAKEEIYQVKTDDNGVANASFIHWNVIQGQVLSAQTYEDGVRHGNDVERFHMKPLRIDQTEAVENGIYSYESFVHAVKEIQQAQVNQELSSSVLEGIKNVIYSGKESYELYFDKNQTEACHKVTQIMHEAFNCNRYGAMQEEQGKSLIYTYLLNDVIDALPYLNQKREAAKR
ncbi:Cas10/Cmr2 second palm domain-containing protein [Paenibacillus sp. 481]|uniref:Cas10/Cmr2 second palm domain-containing protein n=1 Tax=Paenibacillus sp. 481 TaxID=2835869 RepID=UPI001E523286|nr:hypothetical protein [Paenibacillus sp. 481]UHA72128.1 hypothetical protein KIK04_15640 [Paenibacillus sp. 481]